MENKNKPDRLDKRFIFIVSICLLCTILFTIQYMSSTATGDETSVDAEVTVTSNVNQSYGDSVFASSRVLLAERALGEPDNLGSYMFMQGWKSLELEGTVADCSNVSIWLSKRGWQSSRFKVYISSDGSNWAYIGGGTCKSSGYIRYDFNGVFGGVKYIKVERDQNWSWSMILLDAVWAKGGDA